MTTIDGKYECGISIFYCDYFMIDTVSVKTYSGSRLFDHRAFENLLLNTGELLWWGLGLSQKHEWSMEMDKASSEIKTAKSNIVEWQ